MSTAPIYAAARFVAALVLVVSWGCTSMKTTNTARTSTEQLLISNAVDQSLDKIDFRPFAGHAVFLDEKYVDCVDKAYVLASLRHRLLHVGSKLVDKADEAEIVLEPRAGTVGTTNSDTYLGIPEITLPGMMTLPEIRLATRNRQVGVAKIGVVAYDPKTRTTLGEGGTTLATSDDVNLSVFGIGPFQSGTIRNEVTRSTSGSASFSRGHIPNQVAFNAPAPRLNPVPAAIPQLPASKVEYTSVDESASDEPPAQIAAPEAAGSDAPSWAK